MSSLPIVVGDILPCQCFLFSMQPLPRLSCRKCHQAILSLVFFKKRGFQDFPISCTFFASLSPTYVAGSTRATCSAPTFLSSICIRYSAMMTRSGDNDATPQLRRSQMACSYRQPRQSRVDNHSETELDSHPHLKYHIGRQRRG